MKTPKSKKQMSLCLEQTAEGRKLKWGPLGDVIDEALETVNGKDRLGGALSLPFARRWLVERAIRAVCKMIIRDGCMICPLEVAQEGSGARLSGTNLYGKEARPIQSKTATVEFHAVTKAGVETQCAIELTAEQLWRVEIYAKHHGKSPAAMLGKFIDFSTLPDETIEKPDAIAEMEDAANELRKRTNRN